MNATTKLLFVGTMGISGTFATGGCQSCPDDAIYQGDRLLTQSTNCLTQTRRYTRTPVPSGLDWRTVRGHVTIRNSNGSIDIETGPSELMQTPFVDASIAATEERPATDRLAKVPLATFFIDSFGSLIVKSEGIDFTEGLDMRLTLPPTFRGAIITSTGRGEIRYRREAASRGNLLSSEHGDVTATLEASSNVTVTSRATNGEVAFSGAWRSKDIAADRSHGTAVAGDGLGSLELSTGKGNVNVTLE